MSMRLPRQEYWSGLPFSPPGDLHDPGIEPHLLCLLHWQAGSLPTMPPGNSFLSIRSFFIKWNFTKDPILFFLLAAPHGVWDLSSPIRDRIWIPCISSMESQPMDHQGSLSLYSLKDENGWVVFQALPSPPASSLGPLNTALPPAEKALMRSFFLFISLCIGSIISTVLKGVKRG